MIKALLARLDEKMGVGPGWGLPLALLQAAVAGQVISILVMIAAQLGWIRQFVQWLQ